MPRVSPAQVPCVSECFAESDLDSSPPHRRAGLAESAVCSRPVSALIDHGDTSAYVDFDWRLAVYSRIFRGSSVAAPSSSAPRPPSIAISRGSGAALEDSTISKSTSASCCGELI